jgi:hypothetical protein
MVPVVHVVGVVAGVVVASVGARGIEIIGATQGAYWTVKALEPVAAELASITQM